MQKIDITRGILTQGTEILEGTPENLLLKLSKEGSGLFLPQLAHCTERYFVFFIELSEDHSLPMNLLFYSREEPDGKPAFNLRFGIMPRIRTLICIDLQWLNGSLLFPENNEGQLKVVCHGRRLEPSEIDHVVLANYPCFHDVVLKISGMHLAEDPPESYPLPDVKLIDEMGQYKNKQWLQKTHDIQDLRNRLEAVDRDLPEGYFFTDWSRYGGWTCKKLAEGSGFFSKIKADGRWWLVDPLGYAFFSMGPDCVGVRSDCRVDGIEKFMDWLPETDNPEYGSMYSFDFPFPAARRRKLKLFSFEQANLYRVFGKDWDKKWAGIMSRQLKQNGMNTLGNWSDRGIFNRMGMPYVTSLSRFPTTKQTIFRDFPDVFGSEYAENARKAAEELRPFKGDPHMIGYFLGNEPSWAFVEHIVLADEVLYNPARTACKEKLIEFLKNRYTEISFLNKAWGTVFESFNELYSPVGRASKRSEAACRDMKEFSRILLEAYISVPSRACREEDPDHMNLGLRWAWISDPDVVTGWQHFDVFSINCYAMDPTDAIENVKSLGVDLPVIIGEFHFGALDRGLTATGLEAVQTQEDRGLAYRYYTERVAAHSYGVGCHYFQFYDQFALGRFDGENYNIGLFDICSRPYAEMMDSIRACSEGIYEIAEGKRKPVERRPSSIPMIAY